MGESPSQLSAASPGRLAGPRVGIRPNFDPRNDQEEYEKRSEWREIRRLSSCGQGNEREEGRADREGPHRNQQEDTDNVKDSGVRKFNVI